MGTLTPDLHGPVKVSKNLVRSKFNSSNTTINMAKYVKTARSNMSKKYN